MSASRAPSAPPILPGFEFLELLGSGGFADVFLYQQQMPRRRVAVKVLLAEQLRTGSADEFTAEANVMAMLSTHPSIVTIYEAGVSGDGRPYLAMEYCPKPNLQVRYRRERFDVGEALRIAIQVAGAVETSHRAGILHRDIKPANILVTEYNRPALTDFGISATTSDGEAAPMGMSIPWSPPESFMSPPRSGATSDVYALGATIYTLLAGRSPFQLPGASNTSADVMSRIGSYPLPGLGRADVPASLDAVFARAMSKTPTDRYASALDFARALQKVQIELAMSVTMIDVLDDAVEAPDDRNDDDGLTRVRNIVSIDPEAPRTAPQAATTSRPLATTPWPTAATAVPGAERDLDETVPPGGLNFTRGPAAQRAALDDTYRRPISPPVPDTSETEGPRRRRWLTPVILGGLLLVVGGGVTAAVLLGGTAPDSPDTATEVAAPVDAVAEVAVPNVSELVATVSGTDVAFTWANPTPETGDLYLWRVVETGQDNTVASVAEPSVTVPASASGTTCIEVSLRRDDGRSSADSVLGCTP
ncbi:serine/threonine protein kinase [Cryobacterium frigoriphilum]|uniref:non-specific serine/threonine protein kinase n=1 Tax=Cryobacterium frigoriphilum TaxID=1259150 RepID=A0A4R8ZUN7_9MICO|nr:serine/threonine-protein kinase [Cryobacterium frigoriphilum]TFD46345.1 serine/threonine protein kinase [Cryobacterium frigoriphilum]